MIHPVFTVSLLAAGVLAAQAPKASTKENLQAQNVRETFLKVLDATDAAWFGQPYQGVNGLDLEGRLSITMSAAAANAKVAQATQGAVKGSATKSGRATLQMKGSYTAKGDFRTELAGDGGHLVYTRVGTRGYMYSKELNAFHNNVDRPPLEAPVTYMGWFRDLVLEVKKAYGDNKAYQVSFDKPEGNLQTLVYHISTGTYDPKKREQSLDDSLDFWKKGHLRVTFDKTTQLPVRAFFENVAQGVKATLNFQYGPNSRLSNVSIHNQSRGMEGPAGLRVSYGNDGLMRSIAGEMDAKVGRIAWDFTTSWSKDKKIAFMPPPAGAGQKGKEDFQAMAFVNLAGQIMDLQRHGLNLRSVSLPK